MLKYDDGSLDETAIEVNGVAVTVLKVIDRRLRRSTLYRLAVAA